MSADEGRQQTQTAIQELLHLGTAVTRACSALPQIITQPPLAHFCMIWPVFSLMYKLPSCARAAAAGVAACRHTGCYA